MDPSSEATEEDCQCEVVQTEETGADTGDEYTPLHTRGQSTGFVESGSVMESDPRTVRVGSLGSRWTRLPPNPTLRCPITPTCSVSDGHSNSARHRHPSAHGLALEEHTVGEPPISTTPRTAFLEGAPAVPPSEITVVSPSSPMPRRRGPSRWGDRRDRWSLLCICGTPVVFGAFLYVWMCIFLGLDGFCPGGTIRRSLTPTHTPSDES
jgi:hypothetical protein